MPPLSGIATEDIVLQVTLVRQTFWEIHVGGGGGMQIILLVMWGRGAHVQGVPR